VTLQQAFRALGELADADSRRFFVDIDQSSYARPYLPSLGANVILPCLPDTGP
jgi:hypothetical protein